MGKSLLSGRGSFSFITGMFDPSNVYFVNLILVLRYAYVFSSQKFEEAANAFYEGVQLDPENKELVHAFRF